MDPYQFWSDRLKSPKYILAPMVDHSELPWRMLSRKFGCHLAYTPMYHAANFASSKKYRQKNFTTCSEDRPLIVQFCANNPDHLLEAAKYVKDCCDGIDINLGCPQDIARRGHYGAFLQDEWDLIEKLVKKLVETIGHELAISCKIRRFETISKTVEYAKMLERAGCTFLGIHGRTREQRGCRTGLADWDHIKAVKESLSIPIIANGNIQSAYDANECLRYTGADAVMTAEGNLYNPGLFMNKHFPAWDIAYLYLDYVRMYPIPAGMAKSHLFKLFHRCVAIEDNVHLRNKLVQSTSLEQLESVVGEFKKKYCISESDLISTCSHQELDINTLPVPPYLTQPHYRYETRDTIVVGQKFNDNTEPVQSDNFSPNDEGHMEETDRSTFQKRIKLTS